MQLKDIVKKIEDMTDEELHAHLLLIRRRRTTDRPVAKAKAAKVETKKSRGRLTAIDKILATLSPEDQAELLQSLETPNEGSSGQG